MELMIVYLQMLEVGGAMTTLLYSDSNQENMRNMLLSHNHSFIDITNLTDLDLFYNGSDFPILVILSQPSKQMMEKLISLRWSSILSFIGVRFNNECESNLVYFEEAIEFSEKLNECMRIQKKDFERDYIEQLDLLTEDDHAFIQSLSGQSIEYGNNSIQLKGFSKKKVLSPITELGLITVMGNTEVAFHLAKTCAKHSKERVLIIDGNLLNPSLESYFKLTRTSTKIKSHLAGLDNSGMNIALDTVTKGFDLEENIHHMTHYGGKNLRVLLGNYNLFNYEHYDIKQIKVMITKMLRMFGTIIIAVSENPYDSLTMLGLHMSKVNIIACKNNHPDARYIYNLIKVLKTKQGLSQSKNLVVSFNSYQKLPVTSRSVLRALFHKNYLGHFDHANFFTKSMLTRIRERSITWD